jgi:hypothetical protein
VRLVPFIVGVAVTLSGLSLILRYGPTTRVVLALVLRLYPASRMAAREHVVPLGVVLVLAGIGAIAWAL